MSKDGRPFGKGLRYLNTGKIASLQMVFFFFFFSIHTYTHVQFEQLHKYIQKRNKIYKKWYTQKQSLDIKLFGISRKQTKKKKKNKQKGDVSS